MSHYKSNMGCPRYCFAFLILVEPGLLLIFVAKEVGGSRLQFGDKEVRNVPQNKHISTATWLLA